MGEKKTKSTGKTVAIAILSILLVGAVGFIGYDKFIIKEDSTQSTNNKEKNTSKEEIDINSRLVQSLYEKVSIEKKEGLCYNGLFHEGSDKIYANKMSNKEKMILVGNSLLNSRKKIIDCNSNIPDSQGNEGYLFSACYLNNKNNTYEYQYAYEKDYIESVYKNIFGTKENFDTSEPINNYYYNETLNEYVEYLTEGGMESTCGDNDSTSLTLKKAFKTSSEIKLVELVNYTKREDGPDGISETIDDIVTKTDYNYVYTFKLEDDGMYSFYSRIKES